MARSATSLESFPYVVRIKGVEVFCANPFAVADLLRRLDGDDEGQEEPGEPQEDLVESHNPRSHEHSPSSRQFRRLSESEKHAKVEESLQGGASHREAAAKIGISKTTFEKYTARANGKPHLPGKHVIVIRPGGRTMYWSRRGAASDERWEPELMHAVRYDSREEAELFREKHPSLKRASIEALSNGA